MSFRLCHSSGAEKEYNDLKVKKATYVKILSTGSLNIILVDVVFKIIDALFDIHVIDL